MLSFTITLLFSSFAPAQVYAVDLIEPPAGSFITYGYGINDDGDVAGYHVIGVGVWKGFHWNGTAFTTLEPLPGGSVAEAYDLNNADAIIGMSADASGFPRAVRWAAPGALPADLGDLGGTDARASGINAGGVVTGMSFTPGATHAFRHAGAMVDLGSLGYLESWGKDVNAGGSIAGHSINPGVGPEAVHWPPGAVAPTSIHDAALFTYSYAEGIADSGAVTGWAGTASGAVHGFRWTAGFGMIDLGSPVGQCTPYDINSGDWIVATCGFLGTPVAYVRNPVGGAWLNLNDRVPHGCGLTYDEARAINTSGQITGFGTKIGTSDVRAYRLTPVPSGLALGRLSPALAGASNEISILGGNVGAEVHLVGGLAAGATAVRGCVGLTADIAVAKVLGARTVDASKRATFHFLVPMVMAGRSGLLQAVERSSCRKSNLVISAIG